MDILTKALGALWQVAAVGLLLGAGLPALFALGVRSLEFGRACRCRPTAPRSSPRPARSGRPAPCVCFGICILAVAVRHRGDRLRQATVREVTMASLPGVLGSILDWLRAGYPDGIPSTDYVPLMVVLARRLSTDEVRAVADELTRSGDVPAGALVIDNIDIGTEITKITNELPAEDDVRRVRARLAQGGWPLADPRVA